MIKTLKSIQGKVEFKVVDQAWREVKMQTKAEPHAMVESIMNRRNKRVTNTIVTQVWNQIND